MTARDTQRQRVYMSERVLPARSVSPLEARRLIRVLCRDVAHVPACKVYVRAGGTKSMYRPGDPGSLRMLSYRGDFNHPRLLSLKSLLHELAHHIEYHRHPRQQGRKATADHGPEWLRIAAGLYAVCGLDDDGRFIDACRKNGAELI